MEFFRHVDCPDMDIDAIKSRLTIARLPTLCASIDTVLSDAGNEGEIYCLWGQFMLRREVIRYGVRFTLLNCPHALAWTITCHEPQHRLTIHCTIDKQEEDREFIESIHVFVDDWVTGLRNDPMPDA